LSDIFISYARIDRKKASIIAGSLKSKGWSVWWDRKILPGKPFDEIIEKALGESKCVVVLWSKVSITRPWVKEEAREGLKKEILVPALIDEVDPPLGFKSIQAANLVNWNGTSPNTEFDKFVESISLIVNSSIIERDVEILTHDNLETDPEEYELLTSYIGLDIGLKHSVISIYNESNCTTEIVEIEDLLGNRTPLIPNVLVFDKNSNSCKIGFEAENMSSIYPELTIRSIRRVLGYNREHVINNRIYSPAQLAGLLINKLKEICVNHLIETKKKFYDIQHAIVVVPAFFYDLQIRDILEACKIAKLYTEDITHSITKEMDNDNFNVVGGIIIDEPSATALYFVNLFHDIRPDLIEEIEQGQIKHMLIFDYGDDYLDVSIVCVDYYPKFGIGIKVLSNKKNNKIGSDQIDLVILNQMLNASEIDYPNFDTTLISDNFKKLNERKENEQWCVDLWVDILRIRSHWKEEAINCKKALSEVDQFQFYVSRRDIITIKEGQLIESEKDFIFNIEKLLFENWIAGLLMQCEDVINKVIDQANLNKEDITNVIHTGHSSLIYGVQQRVREIFPTLDNYKNIILFEEHLRICVAQGAALYGAQRKALQAIGKGVYLIEKARKLPYGYGTHKNSYGKLFYDPIVPIGESYPLHTIKSYSPEECPGHIKTLFLSKRR